MCGIFACILKDGCHNAVDIAGIIRDGLLQLQHRGQESSGMVGSTGPNAEHFCIVKGTGLVSNVYTVENLCKLSGCSMALGHNRYSTSGLKDAINCIQPFVMYTANGLIALAHNGELINNKALRKKMLQKGYALSTDTDSEMLSLFLASAPIKDQTVADWPGRIQYLMEESALSYSFVLMAGKEHALYAVRDPYGNRPLSIAELRVPDPKIPKAETTIGWAITSETCAFSCVGARCIREVQPGEILRIDGNGLAHGIPFVVSQPQSKLSFCIFEYVYFASAASWLEGQQVYTVRQRCGERLGLEAPVEADIVSNVPDTSTPAAKGYSKQTGIPYTEVLLKNSYVGRTFIRPNTQLRVSSINLKFSPLDQNFCGKRVVLVDDSIVRGNTMKQIVKMLKDHGAKEVHVRVASPPIMHPCYMGINIPTRNELQANSISDIKHYRNRKQQGLADYESRELAKELGADSLVYLSVEGLVTAVKGKGNDDRGYCIACLTEEYPIDPPPDIEEIVNGFK